MREQEVKGQDIDVDVPYNDTSGWYSSYRLGEKSTAAKILVHRTSHRIVGTHLLGPECGELVNCLALAMNLELTTRRLKSRTAIWEAQAAVDAWVLEYSTDHPHQGLDNRLAFPTDRSTPVLYKQRAGLSCDCPPRCQAWTEERDRPPTPRWAGLPLPTPAGEDSRRCRGTTLWEAATRLTTFRNLPEQTPATPKPRLIDGHKSWVDLE